MVSQVPSGVASLSRLREEIFETVNSASTSEEIVSAVAAYVDLLEASAEAHEWPEVRPLFAEALDWLVTYREEIPPEFEYYDYDFEAGLKVVARLALANSDTELSARILGDGSKPTDVFNEYSPVRRSLFLEDMKYYIADAVGKGLKIG